MRIIALDSCVPGAHHGYIDDHGLAWLARTLGEDAVKPTIVMLHHPPFVSGIPYMDADRYFDAEPLAAVLYLGPPGCMLHLWTAEDGMVTHVSHIGDYAGPFPFA